MSYLTVVTLMYIFLFVVESAPISSFDPPPLFTEAAERAKTLVEKILRDIPTVYAATIYTEGLTLDTSDTSPQMTNLQMMIKKLGIPAAPVLKPPSEHFSLDICVSRMLVGSRLHQVLLRVLSEKLSALSDLQADLRDLQTHISKMKEVAQLSGGVQDPNHSLDLAYHLRGNYEVQVAAHLTLTQLRSFCHDLIRSLRVVATYRPQAAVAH